MKIETYLPVFPGFYNTIFEPCEDGEIEYINDLRAEKGLKPIEFDAFEFDYQTYQNDVSESCCEVLEAELSDFIENIKFQALQSPKFYNYSNDSINCEIDVKINKVMEYLKSHKSDWNDYLKDNYTSCSGFISSYDNYADSPDWSEDAIISGGHQLGAVLNFLCIEKDITQETLYYGIESYLICTNFDKLTEETK